MKKVIVLYFIFSFLPSISLAYKGNGNPVKYISSCEMDFDNDNKVDIAFLVETFQGRELIALMNRNDGYESFVILRGIFNMHLSCHFGETVKETKAGKGMGRTFKTSGTYIRLTQPESSSVVYFWKDNRFQEVWISD